MEAILLALVGLTSVGIYLFGRMGLGLSGRGLKAAVGKVLECVGATILFFGLNLVVAVIVILVIRRLTGHFVLLYPANDVAWLILSLAQALIFQWWRELAKKPAGGSK